MSNIITTTLIYTSACIVAYVFQEGILCIDFLNRVLRVTTLRIYSKGKGVEAHRGNRGMAPLILNLGTRFRSVINIMPRPFYPLGEKPVPSKQKAGWTPKSVWTFLQKRTSLVPAGDSIPGQSSP